MQPPMCCRVFTSPLKCTGAPFAEFSTTCDVRTTVLRVSSVRASGNNPALRARRGTLQEVGEVMTRARMFQYKPDVCEQL